MAVGDDAQAGGFPIVPETGEAGRIRWGALEINRTRDFVALVKATIPTTKAAFRIASGITFGVGDPSGGADGDVHFKVAGGVTTTYVRSGGLWIKGATSSDGGETPTSFSNSIGSLEASNGVPPPTPPNDGKYHLWFNAEGAV
jgi:hypothetical protein